MDASSDRERKLRAGKAKLAAYMKRKSFSAAINNHVSTEINCREFDKGMDAVGAGDMMESEAEDPNLETSPTATFQAEIVASGEHSHSSSISTGSDLSQKLEECSSKLEEYQDALKQRDDVINRLTERLQQTISQRDQLHNDSTSQADALVTEIEILKLQLQQANEFLQAHNCKNGISAQELLEAQNQAIALQKFVVQKDAIIEDLKRDASTVRNVLREKDLENIRLRERIAAGENETTNANHVTPNTEEEIHKLRKQLKTIKAKSSNEVKQLMEDLEIMQKQLHQSQLSCKDAESRLEMLRAELDEQYGHQIVEMKAEITRVHREEVQLLTERLSKANADGVTNSEVEMWQEKLREAITEKEVIEGGYKARLNEANERIRALTQDNEEAKIRIDRLTSEKNDSDARSRQLSDELAALELEMRNHREQFERLCCDDENLRRHLDCDISIDFSSIVAQFAELREENAALKSGEARNKYTSSQSTQTFISGQTLKQLLHEKLDLEAELNQASASSSRILVGQLTTIADDCHYENFVDTAEDEDVRQATSFLQAEVEALRLDNVHLQQDLAAITERYNNFLSDTGRHSTVDSNVLTTLRNRVENLMSELERRDLEYSKVVTELSMLKEEDAAEDIGAFQSRLETMVGDTERVAIQAEKDALLETANVIICTLQGRLLEAESDNVRLQIELSASETNREMLEDQLKTLTKELRDPETLQRRLSSRVSAIEKEGITVQRASVLGMGGGKDVVVQSSDTALQQKLDALKQLVLQSENSRKLLLQQLSASETKKKTFGDELKILNEELNDPETLQRRLSSRVDNVERQGIAVQKASLLGMDCSASTKDVVHDSDTSMQLQLDVLNHRLLESENSRKQVLQQLSVSETHLKTLEDEMKMLTKELTDPERLQKRLSSRVDIIESEGIVVQRASLLGMGGNNEVTVTTDNSVQQELDALKEQLLESENARKLLLQQLSASETKQKTLEDELKSLNEELADPEMLQRRLSTRVDTIESEAITVEKASLLGTGCENDVIGRSDSALQQELDALKEQLSEAENFRKLLLQQLDASEAKQKTLEDELKGLHAELDDPDQLQRRLSSRVEALEKEGIIVQRASLLGIGCGNDVIDSVEISLQQELDALKEQFSESENSRKLLLQQLSASETTQKTLEEKLKCLNEELADPEMLRRRHSSRVDTMESEAISVEKASLLGMGCENQFADRLQHELDALQQQLLESDNSRTWLLQELSASETKRKALEDELNTLNEELTDPEMLRRRLSSRVEALEKDGITVQRASLLGTDSSGDDFIGGSDSALQRELEALKQALLESENSRTLLLQQLSASETKQKTLEDELAVLSEELKDPETLRRRLSSRVEAFEKDGITVQRASLLGLGCENDVIATPDTSLQQQLDALRQQLLESENAQKVLLQELRASEMRQKTLEDELRILGEELDDPEVLKRRLSSRVDTVEREGITVQRAVLLGSASVHQETDVDALNRKLLECQTIVMQLTKELSVCDAKRRELEDQVRELNEQLGDPDTLRNRLTACIQDIEKAETRVESAFILGLPNIVTSAKSAKCEKEEDEEKSALEDAVEQLNSLLLSSSSQSEVQSSGEILLSEKAATRKDTLDSGLSELSVSPMSAGDAPLTVMVFTGSGLKDPDLKEDLRDQHQGDNSNDAIACECNFRQSGGQPRSLLDFECQVDMEMVLEDVAALATQRALEEASSPDRDLVAAKLELELEFADRSKAAENELKLSFEAERDELLQELRRTKEILVECETKLSAFKQQSLDAEADRSISETQRWEEREAAIRKELQKRYDDDVERVRQSLEDSLVDEAHAGVEAEVSELKDRVEANIAARNNENDRLSKELDELKAQLQQLQRDKRRLERSLPIGEFVSTDDEDGDGEFGARDVSTSAYDISCELIRGGEDGVYLQLLTNITSVCLNLTKNIDKEFVTLLGENTVDGKPIEDADASKEPYSMVHQRQPEDLDETVCRPQDQDSFVSLLTGDRHGSPLPGLEHSLSDIVSEAGNRLSNAVSRLLDVFRESVQQLQESHVVQDQLANCSLQSNDEVATLKAQTEDIVAQLKVEEQTKDCLAVELHKITGLLKTCDVEKAELEEKLERKEMQLEQISLQLEDVRARSRSLEDSLAEEQQRRNLRRVVVTEGLGEHVQLVHPTWNDPNVHIMNAEDEELLEENSRLHIEKRGLQYHGEKDRDRLSARIQELEQVAEEMSTNHDRTIETKRQEIEDLQQQIDALEKQLKAYKQFVEEQTAEREQEREEFHNELVKLNDVMREKEKGLSSGLQLTREVESLAEQLKEKDLVLANIVDRRDQLERDVEVLNDKLNTSQEVLRELERQLDCKSRNEHDLKEEMDELKLALSNSARVHDEQCQEIEELRNASMSMNNRTLGVVPFLDDYMTENGLDATSASAAESLMMELRLQMHTLEDKVGRHIRDLEALQLTSSSLSSPCSEEVSVREQLEALRSQGRPDISLALDINGSVPLELSFGAYIKDVHRLDDRIESMTRAKEIAIKKIKDLDAQLQKQKQIEEDLLQDRDVLQKQLNAQLIVISALQARIEEQRLRVSSAEPVEKIHAMQDELDKQKSVAEQLSKKVDDLREELNLAHNVAQGYELQVHDLMNRYTSEVNQNKSEKLAAKREMDDLSVQVETFKAKLEESEKQSNDLSSLLQTVIQEKNQELDMMTSEIKRLEQESCQQIETDSKNKGQLVELSETIASQKEELQALRKKSDALWEKLTERESESKELNKLLLVKEKELRRATDTVDQKRREVDALKVVLEEKAQLVEQVQMLQSELHDLTNYQSRLQEDFDTVQAMLEDKQAELAEMQSSRDASLEEQCNAKNHLEALRKQIADRLASLADSSVQVNIGNDELEALQKQNNLLRSKCNAVEDDLTAAEKRQADLESILEAERQATVDATNQLTRKTDELISTKAEVEASTAKMAHVREQLQSLESQLTSAGSELKEVTDQKNRLEAEVAWRNNKIFRLEDEVEQLKNVPVANEDGGSQTAVHKFLQEVQKELLSESVASVGRIGQTSTEVSTSESEADSSSVMEGLPPRVRILVKKIYEEGVSVLNLSELRAVQEHSSADRQTCDALRSTVVRKSWENERRHLIAEIHALKDLLSRLTSLVGSSRDQLPLNASWLPQLLLAVANLITKENNLLIATVQSSVASSRHTNETDVQKLEIGISEMNRLFKNLLQTVEHLTSSVECDATASSVEAKSRSWEVQIAVARERLKHQEEQKKLMQDMRELDHQMGQNERRFKRQMELLKFRVQQEELIAEDLRHSLELEKSHCIELCGQCTREKGRAAHLELAAAQLRSELANYRATAEQLRQELKNVTQQHKSEKVRSETLLQSLQAERDSFVQLQEAMEAEKRRAKTSYQREQQIIEELRNALETERVKQLEMTSALERERLALHDARQELKSQRTTVDSNMNACLSDDGKLRRKPPEQSNGSAGGGGGGHSNNSNRVVEEFQDALDLERQKNRDLSAVLQREHRRVASVTSSLSQERRQLLQDLDAERTNVVQLQCKLEVAHNQKTNLSRELNRSQEQTVRLESEQERLISDLSAARAELQQRDQEVDALRQIQQDLHKEFEVDREQERHKQHDLRLTTQKLQQRITFLEKELEFAKQSEGNLQQELDDERLNRPSSHNMLLRPSTMDNVSRFHQSGFETIRQQLLLLLCKVRDELPLANSRGGVAYESLPDAIDQLIAEVGKLCQATLSSSQSEDEITSNHLCLTERIVKHNSELAEFARHLCDEKLQLRVALSKASRDVESQANNSPSSHHSQSASDQVLVAERATWAQERAGLQRALHRAEAELLRTVGVSRLSSNRLAAASPRNTMDDSKATHFYYKYLRAQSFRKNLIYQKGYLLDLLAGYQDTETATLDMLGRLGCLDDDIDVERLGSDRNRSALNARKGVGRKAVNRFRCAAHVVVAVTRMRFLAFRRKRVKHSLCPNNSALPRSADVEMLSPGPPTSHSMYPTFTPPVRDIQQLQFDSDRNSSSTARRSLSLNTDSSYSSTQSLAALGEYVQRFENLQQQLGIGVPVADMDEPINNSNLSVQ